MMMTLTRAMIKMINKDDRDEWDHHRLQFKKKKKSAESSITKVNFCPNYHTRDITCTH